MDAYLLLFVKAPVPGEVKTRLRPLFSDEEARELYQCLARDTLASARHVRDVRLVLAYAAHPRAPDCSWLSDDLAMFRQRGEDLGERLTHAFRWAFRRKASRVVAVGSDAPEVSTSWLREAFQALTRTDVVLGPATDGGYHLIGLTRPHPALFADMPWSTNRLFSRTLTTIRRVGLTVRCLSPIADLDTPGDVQQYLAISHSRRRTHTARYLQRHLQASARLETAAT